MKILIIISSMRKTAPMLHWTVENAPPDCEFLILPTSRSSNPASRTTDEDIEKIKNIANRTIDDLNINGSIIALSRRRSAEAILKIIKRKNIDMLVMEASRNSYDISNYADITEKLFRDVACQIILMDPGRSAGPTTNRPAIPMDIANHQVALRFALNQYPVSTVNPFVITTETSQDAIETATQEIEILVNQTNLNEEQKEKIEPLVIAATNYEDVHAQLQECDLLVISSRNPRALYNVCHQSRWRTTINTPNKIAMILVRPARVSTNRIISEIYHRIYSNLPEPTTADRNALFEKVYTGSRINPDFWFMMILSVGIATVGLIKDSEAVVIGAMLVAPMMTPLIGAGLALTLDDLRLFRCSISTMTKGILLGLGLSFIIAKITPTDDITMAVMARGTPNLLDLLIAIFSGMAAGYAFSRVAVAEAIVGVAVAAALVPPLCSMGIALGEGNLTVAEGAALLFLTNILAIIFGCALILRTLRFHRVRIKSIPSEWVKKVLIGLGILLIGIALPLQRKLSTQIMAGQVRPVMFPLSGKLLSEIEDVISKEKGVSLLTAGRGGPPGKPEVKMILLTDDVVSEELIDNIKAVFEDHFPKTDIDFQIAAMKDMVPANTKDNEESKK